LTTENVALAVAPRVTPQHDLESLRQTAKPSVTIAT